MFRDACAIAQQFTLPVIFSQRTAKGQCSSAIGAFVVINEQGWIATAGHVLETSSEGDASARRCRERENEAAAIRVDSTLNDKERRDKLRALGHAKPDDVDRCSAYWGGLPGNPHVAEAAIIKGIDIGVARLEPFDPGSIARYPVFKDPTINFQPGTSLCKLGFPFHAITPTYIEERNLFELPGGALPVPFFPIEGIFTRTAQLVVKDGEPPQPRPLMWVETSSPGLRGQSGGPTFDTQGTIWAIQAQTSHLSLGFSPKIPEQYLHVGLGVHPQTLFSLFDELGVEYKKSDY